MSNLIGLLTGLRSDRTGVTAMGYGGIAAAAFLLGPEAGFVTGTEWVIDGGTTRKMIYA